MGVVYTTVYAETDKTLAGFPVDAAYNVGDQNARYIKFTNIARGTQYGVSFWEFRVFKMENTVLSSILLSADKTWAKVGESVALTAQGKDQIGADISAGDVAYEVIPAEAGTVADGIFTPAKGGEVEIVAKSGAIESNPIKIKAYSGEKINI